LQIFLKKSILASFFLTKQITYAELLDKEFVNNLLNYWRLRSGADPTSKVSGEFQ